MEKHRFTPEQIEFIKTNVVGNGRAELTTLFNNRFQMRLGKNQITAFVKNNKLNSGLDGRFKPGSIPFNKGKKGACGWEPTQFKKGNKPWNYKPVGTERVNCDGYVDVKIADPNKWRAKHVLIWEAANGQIPKGHALVFADGDKLHVSLDNLILVTRGQLARLNQNHLIQNDPELTKSGVIIADIITKCAERKKQGRRRRVPGVARK